MNLFAILLLSMAIHFYNTLTRKEEEFQPIHPGHVSLYSCGPTVYDYAHIGNFRTFIFEDILRRTIKANGLEIRQIKNLTDVDDKTIRGSQKAKMPLKDFTEKFTVEFFKDCDAINLERADVYPKATDHITEMILMIQSLLDKGIAYTTDDGVYFSISKMPNYGELAHLDLAGLKAGASGRVLSDEYEKENVADFALWKFWQEADGEVKWPAPFGDGRPGWHIECSAMSAKHLTHLFDDDKMNPDHFESMDIHTGGIDLLFPHHQDEVAQTQGCTGKPLSHFWMHAEHLLVDGKKMSKSLGNFYTLRDVIEKGFDPMAMRFLFLGSSYHAKLNFTWEALQGAQNALHKLYAIARGLDQPAIGCADYERDFIAAINNDLNTPMALAVMWKMLDDPAMSSSGKAESLLSFDKVLGLKLADYVAKPIEVPTDVLELGRERESARTAKDWNRSDELRDLIASKGFTVEDTPEGQKIH